MDVDKMTHLILGESENRQATGVSQVTTEAPSDEDD